MHVEINTIPAQEVDCLARTRYSKLNSDMPKCMSAWNLRMTPYLEIPELSCGYKEFRGEGVKTK